MNIEKKESINKSDATSTAKTLAGSPDAVTEIPDKILKKRIRFYVDKIMDLPYSDYEKIKKKTPHFVTYGSNSMDPVGTKTRINERIGLVDESDLHAWCDSLPSNLRNKTIENIVIAICKDPTRWSAFDYIDKVMDLPYDDYEEIKEKTVHDVIGAYMKGDNVAIGIDNRLFDRIGIIDAEDVYDWAMTVPENLKNETIENVVKELCTEKPPQD